jgi:GT2 family glycosyltransferase
LTKFRHLTEQAARLIPHDLDVCVSFVLFDNDKDEVTRAIQQVQASRISSHIVIVDNSCPPLDLGYAAASGATVLSTGKNIGYGRGHNIALHASKGKCRYNLVMNTDLQTEGDTIAEMVAFMDTHLDAGLAMPKVRYPDGSLQRLCRLLPNPADMIARRVMKGTKWAKARNNRYEFHGWNYDTVGNFPFLSGCFMLCRRSVLDCVGYFDERYFLYAEDLDLSRRIHSVAKTLFNPDQSVIHEYRSQSTPSLARVKYAAVSLCRYFSKWGWLVDHNRDRINQAALTQFN